MASSRFLLGVALSGGLHVLAFVQMSHAKARPSGPKPRVVIEVDTQPPPPPLEAKPEPVNPPPDEPAKSSPTEKASRAPSASPSPAAAQAGKVLAADSDDAIADFTMVQGAGVYAGGVTTTNGTSKTAVAASTAGRAQTGPASGAGAGNAESTGPDRSHPARPQGGDWDCSSMFPSAATVDSATVLIVVRVRADGAPEGITVVSDPGQGFGPAARACAMRQRYAPAEDRDGRTVAASTAPFRVRFTR
jgi:periplasmic protein TonB